MVQFSDFQFSFFTIQRNAKQSGNRAAIVRLRKGSRNELCVALRVAPFAAQYTTRCAPHRNLTIAALIYIKKLKIELGKLNHSILWVRGYVPF
jgi:hypothetical protein